MLSYAMVAAMSSDSEENTHVCSSYSSWSLPPAFLAHVLPTLGSASSVNSKTIGISTGSAIQEQSEDCFSLKCGFRGVLRLNMSIVV